MGGFSSGSDAVDAMREINITGNVTPHRWYKTILRDNGKPYLLAITLLSDIVYWYRPVEIRDEATGNTIGYRKRFKSDLFQKTYEQYAEFYGETKRSIKAALDKLEEMEVIRKVFREIKLANGAKIPNVMFIELFPDRLKEITFDDEPQGGTSGPSVQKSDRGMPETHLSTTGKALESTRNQDSVGYPTKFCTTSPEILYDPLQNNATPHAENCTHLPQNSVGYPATDCGTNTENITENTYGITTKNITQITHGEYDPVMSCQAEDVDNPDDDWMDHIDWSKPIKVTAASSMQQIMTGQDMTKRDQYIEMLKRQVEYDRILEEDTYHEQKNIVDGIISVIADIATTEPPDGTERINGRDYPHQVVVSRLTKMDYDTLTHLLGRFKRNTSEIKNMRKYLLTALYNARDEMDIQFQNYFNHTYYNTDWEEERRRRDDIICREAP